jgi:hypothetical protein
MMRLVFLLSAEERGLLLMGDERYEANYALSTLRMHLRKESEEILSSVAGTHGRVCWRSSARCSAALSTKTCACQRWAVHCSIPIVSLS